MVKRGNRAKRAASAPTRVAVPTNSFPNGKCLWLALPAIVVYVCYVVLVLLMTSKAR
jgi:hypothetical protein